MAGDDIMCGINRENVTSLHPNKAIFPSSLPKWNACFICSTFLCSTMFMSESSVLWLLMQQSDFLPFSRRNEQCLLQICCLKSWVPPFFHSKLEDWIIVAVDIIFVLLLLVRKRRRRSVLITIPGIVGGNRLTTISCGHQRTPKITFEIKYGTWKSYNIQALRSKRM